MKQLRVLGFLMFVGGAAMLAMLFTPWKHWAANHSVASLFSAVDRRYGNNVNGPVDMPISMVGDCVLMVTGLWTGLLIPHELRRFKTDGVKHPRSTSPTTCQTGTR